MIRNTATTVLLTATITAAALTQATYVRAASRFDGNWSVVVYTRSGPSDAAYRLAAKSSMAQSPMAAVGSILSGG